MDFSPLLILLFGGLIGWLFRHWRSADELAARRRDQQHQQLSSYEATDNNAETNHSSNLASHHTATQAVSSQIHEQNHDNLTISGSFNGVTLTVIEQELGELYQLSAKVKPLEYELHKTREQLARFRPTQTASSDNLNDSWATLQTAQHEKEFLEFSAEGQYTVHVTSDESAPDEIGELYQLVAKVKPLQYELSRSRKSINSLAADKERVERRLRSQLEQNNQQQETHKLELAKGLATQLTQKDARIAVLKARVEKADRESADQAKNLAELSVTKTDQQLLKQVKLQLIDENTALQSELQSLEEQANKANAESSAAILQQKNELHSLQLQADDQKIQLGNANKRLDDVNRQKINNVEVHADLQKAIAGRDEQIGALGTQLDELSQTTNAALRHKDEAILRTEKFEVLLSKAETHTAELQVQQTQAEQQWRYEMSLLQAATTGFEEFKANASSREAELERMVSQSNSQRLALESRLKAVEADTIELEEALESSQTSAQSFAEYSKIAESKAIQLSGSLSERESEINTITDRVTAAEAKLQQRDQAFQQQARSEQKLAEKYNAAQFRIDKLDEQLEHSEGSKRQLLADVTQAKLQVAELTSKLQKRDVQLVNKDEAQKSYTARQAAIDASQSSDRAQLEKLESELKQSKQQAQAVTDALKQSQQQAKELEEKLTRVDTASQATQARLSELKRGRLSDAHKIGELQVQLKQAEVNASQALADTTDLAQLQAQVSMLKNETRKYTIFQKDAQTTARELLDAKELLKELDEQKRAAAEASDRLTSSNLEIARLQKDLDQSKRFQIELREQSVLLDKLQTQLKQSTETKHTLDDYQSRVSKLEQELKARDAELKTTQSQVHKNAKRDLNRTDKATIALSASKKRISELNKALSKAERAAKKAEQNDLELRRLRSELRSLQAQRDKNAKSLISTKNATTFDTTAADATALKKLENDIARRDKQIEQLMNRLSDAQQTWSDKTRSTANKKPNSRSPDSRSNESDKAPRIKPHNNNPQNSPVLLAVLKAKDDLKRIKGIGPVMEKTLNRLGITSFKQIAEFTKADIQRVSDALKTFPGRIERDDWIGGASKQYTIKYENKAEA
ncbi:MAG: hypothetical protein V3U65_04695 [Granulosicoccaceae bacterium]